MFFLYGILNAFARSLASGTDIALIYDTLQEKKQEKLYKKIVGTYQALWPLGASIGSVIGGYLAAISLKTSINASIIPLILSTIILLFLAEPDYHKEDKKITTHILESVKSVFQNKQLVVISIAFFIMMALGEVMHYLSPIYFNFKEIPLEYFGWISAASFGLSSIGFYISHAISEKLGNKTTLILVTFISPIFTLIATFNQGFILTAFWISTAIYFGIKNPIISHLINLETESKQRATVNSINNFIGQMGIAIMMPIFGYLSDLYSIETTIQLSAVLLLSAPIIFLFLKEAKSNPK